MNECVYQCVAIVVVVCVCARARARACVCGHAFLRVNARLFACTDVYTEYFAEMFTIILSQTFLCKQPSNYLIPSTRFM